ncbi:MAG: sulfotransferase [Hyphomonadaceae bacterium]|nr:sulfotransferase [Hyphomonadaceae bacterium]
MSVGNGSAGTDESALHAIQQAAKAGDVPRAAQLADEALRAGSMHPLLLNLSAVHLESQGRIEEAVSRLEAALRLTPRDPAVRNALAIDLGLLERWEASLANAEAAVELKPEFAAAHVNRGRALWALGRQAPAEASFRRALQLQPGNLMALAGLASVELRKGVLAEARRLAAQVLQAEPLFPDSVAVLAAADIAESKPADAEKRLKALLADARLAAPDRALDRAAAQGLLADALDARDQTKEAFAAYEAAGETLRAHYAKAYGAGLALKAARAHAKYFETSPAWGPRKPAQTRPAAGHVFVIGFPGASRADIVLGRHPLVERLSDQDLFRDFAGGADMERLAFAADAELQPARDAYWARARSAGASLEGKVFLDDDPLNTTRLPLIAALFPDAKVLFARRDPRDCVLAAFRRRQRIGPAAYELLTLQGAADFFVAAMELALRAGEKLGVRSHAMTFEALVADPVKEAKAVCAYIGLDWNDAPQTPANTRLDKPGAWKRYKAEMSPVLDMLRPWVERFGYKNEG